MSVQVQEFDATTDEAIERIGALRARVYEDDEHFVPPFEAALQRDLRRPQFAGRQRAFVARRLGEDVACAVVRRSQTLSLDGKSVATIGNFDALEDDEAVVALLQRAAKWAQDQGSQEVLGPMDGDTWHKYRFSLGPFDERPYFMEPYNPSYYPELWEQAGFEVVQTYHSRCVGDLDGALRHHRPRWASARALGYRVVPMTDPPFEEVLDRVYEMVCTIFADGFLYSPISRLAFGRLYDGVEIMLKGDLSFFIVGPDGDDAGFSFTFPDYAAAVAAMRGKKNLLAKARFMLNRKTSTGNVKTVGVMPHHRGRGLSSAMAAKYFEAMVARGFERVNLCLIMDGNLSTTLDAGEGHVFRRYALYKWGR